MDLLLLLTALFASLTGIGSGDARARQIQDVTVVQASKVAQAVAQRADAVQPIAGIAQSVTQLRQRWAVSRTPMPLVASQRFERRLE